MRRCRPSDHTSGEAMNPPLPSNHRPAPPRAVGRRLIALVASIALAMTGLISMALAPAASAGVAPNLANCALYNTGQVVYNGVDAGSCVMIVDGSVTAIGPHACEPHSELVGGKCRDGNEIDCLNEGGVWNQGELKCYTTDDCVPPSHLMEEDGCSIPTEQEICECAHAPQ